MKNNRLYNVMFPIWFLILMPATWLITIPANFIIDSAVLLLAAHYFCRGREKEIWKKSIVKVFVFGFLSDFIGSGFLTAGLFISSYFEKSTIFEEAAAGATTAAGFFTILFAVVLSGICIFFLDKKWAFGKTDMTEAEIKKISLVMAIATAPYTFFIPLY